MPTYLTDLTPDWLKRLRPENASVFDSPGIKLARWIAGVTGVADPKAQVLGMMAPMETGPVGGLAGALGNVVKGIKAYHGSPHDFEQFSLSKIGTGEGAQSYGHGLYFAEDEGVARSYRDALAPKGAFSKADELFDRYKGQHMTRAEAQRVLSENGLPELAADPFLADDFRRLVPTYDPSAAVSQGSLNSYRRLNDAIEKAHQGRMYEVSIAADPAHFLDWDAPLSEQHPAIRQAMRDAIGDVRPVKLRDGSYSVTVVSPDGSGRIIHGVNESTPEGAMQALGPYLEAASGGEAYHEVAAARNFAAAGSGQMATAQEAATNALHKAGLPGIKYLDAGSRAAGTGTRNYVVFDDKLVSIAKKYMLAGLGVEEAIRRASQDLGQSQKSQGPS